MKNYVLKPLKKCSLTRIYPEKKKIKGSTHRSAIGLRSAHGAFRKNPISIYGKVSRANHELDLAILRSGLPRARAAMKSDCGKYYMQIWGSDAWYFLSRF